MVEIFPFTSRKLKNMSLGNERIQMNPRELQYEVFNWLRFPLMVLVVFIHVKAPSVMLNSSLEGIGVYDVLRRTISIALAQIAVPMFFFISGYLFFNRLHDWKWSVYLDKLKKRCKTLLVPFLLWNTIAILTVLLALMRHEGFQAARDYILNHDLWSLYWCSHEWAGPPSWFGVTQVMMSPCLQPLWFLRDLMVVMVLSPLLWCLFRYLRVWGLLLLLFCYVSAVPLVLGITMTSLFFFGAGAYMNLNQINLPQLAWRYRYVVWFVAIVLLVATIMTVGFDAQDNLKISWVCPFFTLAGSMAAMALAVWALKKGHRIPALLSNSSFFIFVAHALLLEFSYGIFKALLGSGNVLMLILRYLLAAFLLIALCVMAYWLLRKIAPRLCGILTGRR